MPKELDLGRVVGKDAMINGQNAIEIVGGKNISITNDEGTTTISLDGELDNPHFTDKDNPHETTAAQVGAVPITRTVNGKQLNEDITLTSEDTGAKITRVTAAIQAAVIKDEAEKSFDLPGTEKKDESMDIPSESAMTGGIV